MRQGSKSDAERILTLLEFIQTTRNEITDASDVNDITMARVATAIAFKKRSAGFMFRALFEEWDLQRINKELF